VFFSAPTQGDVQRRKEVAMISPKRVTAYSIPLIAAAMTATTTLGILPAGASTTTTLPPITAPAANIDSWVPSGVTVTQGLIGGWFSTVCWAAEQCFPQLVESLNPSLAIEGLETDPEMAGDEGLDFDNQEVITTWGSVHQARKVEAILANRMKLATYADINDFPPGTVVTMTPLSLGVFAIPSDYESAVPRPTERQAAAILGRFWGLWVRSWQVQVRPPGFFVQSPPTLLIVAKGRAVIFIACVDPPIGACSVCDHTTDEAVQDLTILDPYASDFIAQVVEAVPAAG